MGKGFKHGAGGGGASLNFKVVGNPKPENPPENTIWVNVDDASITGWVFSADVPESPVPGLLWIKTGASSTTPFNALKKNSITVYPLSAQQYVDGTWVDVTCQSSRNGEWVDWWNGELYTAGNEWSGITGGWYCKPWKSTSAVGAASNPVVSKEAGYIKMSFDEYRKSGVLMLANKIDLTNFDTLTFEGYIHQNGGSTEQGANGQIYIFSDLDGANYRDNASHVAKSDSIANNGKTGTVTLDVSGLYDEYYVGVDMYSYNSTNAYLIMTDMRLSKGSAEQLLAEMDAAYQEGVNSV